MNMVNKTKDALDPSCPPHHTQQVHPKMDAAVARESDNIFFSPMYNKHVTKVHPLSTVRCTAGCNFGFTCVLEYFAQLSKHWAAYLKPWIHKLRPFLVTAFEDDTSKEVPLLSELLHHFVKPLELCRTQQESTSQLFKHYEAQFYFDEQYLWCR